MKQIGKILSICCMVLLGLATTVFAYTISGYVKDGNGIGLPDVFMQGFYCSDYTDQNGYYSMSVPEGWTGTVTPSLYGYGFTPSDQTYTNVMSDYSDQNYTSYVLPEDNYEENDSYDQAWVAGYKWEKTWLSTIEGSAYLSDFGDYYAISVASGSETLRVNCQFIHANGDIDLHILDSSGRWLASAYSQTDNESLEFVVPASGTYYIEIFGYSLRGNTYDLWWDDLPKHTISGSVRTEAGQGIEGVKLNGLSKRFTDINGFYSASVLEGEDVTVRPWKPGYGFTPSEPTFSNVTTSIEQNFIAKIYAISGYVKNPENIGIPGVTFSGLPGLDGDPVTDASGYYVASGSLLNGWTGMVTPQKDDYRFDPASRSYSIPISGHLSFQNYSGRLSPSEHYLLWTK